MSLIENLIQDGYLKTPEIIEAFKKIKRVDFLSPGDESEADVNAPLSIGYKQTISQPLTVAFMIELLEPEKGDKILDVGCGSGWSAALLAAIVGDGGRVYGLEIIQELKEFACKNISKYNFINKGVVKIFCGDGRQGLREFALFDKIIVAAAAENIPQVLLKQLKAGGRMVIPIGGRNEVQDMVVIDKAKDNKFKEKRFPGFVFVPLIKGN